LTLGLLEAGHDVCSGYRDVATKAFYCPPIATVFVQCFGGKIAPLGQRLINKLGEESCRGFL
jgi:hypothetical protein